MVPRGLQVLHLVGEGSAPGGGGHQPRGNTVLQESYQVQKQTFPYSKNIKKIEKIYNYRDSLQLFERRDVNLAVAALLLNILSAKFAHFYINCLEDFPSHTRISGPLQNYNYNFFFVEWVAGSWYHPGRDPVSLGPARGSAAAR